MPTITTRPLAWCSAGNWAVFMRCVRLRARANCPKLPCPILPPRSLPQKENPPTERKESVLHGVLHVGELPLPPMRPARQYHISISHLPRGFRSTNGAMRCSWRGVQTGSLTEGQIIPNRGSVLDVPGLKGRTSLPFRQRATQTRKNNLLPTMIFPEKWKTSRSSEKAGRPKELQEQK